MLRVPPLSPAGLAPEVFLSPLSLPPPPHAVAVSARTAPAAASLTAFFLSVIRSPVLLRPPGAVEAFPMTFATGVCGPGRSPAASRVQRVAQGVTEEVEEEND